MLFNYDYQRPKVIAEIGCNHMGEIEIAKELIVLAKECGADVANSKQETINYYSLRNNTTLRTLYKIIHTGILMASIGNTWNLVRISIVN